MAQTRDEERLANAPIGPLMLKLAVPAVAAQVINMLYNIVDRIYIGHIPEVGDIALTGVGVTFPILSRNRFSLLLSGIAAGVEKVVLMLSYPSDEVGNHLVSLDQLDEAGIDPWHDVLDLEQFRAAFGKVIHPFTGVDYVGFL